MLELLLVVVIIIFIIIVVYRVLEILGTILGWIGSFLAICCLTIIKKKWECVCIVELMETLLRWVITASGSPRIYYLLFLQVFNRDYFETGRTAGTVPKALRITARKNQ